MTAMFVFTWGQMICKPIRIWKQYDKNKSAWYAIHEVVFVWKFYEAYLTLCFRDFFNEKKNSFAAVVLNGRSPGRVDFRLKKKWSQGTTTTLLERFIILESSKIRERRLSYRYSWFNICVIFFNKDLESSFFF